MGFSGLVLRNIAGSRFRSIVVFACVLIVTALALGAVLVVGGAQASLNTVRGRLGADILVMPGGTNVKAEGALLMGKPVAARMSRENLDKIARVAGVEAVTPQLYLGTVTDSPGCSALEMYVVAFDPQTDFAINSWLTEPLDSPLGTDEALGGTFVYVPEGAATLDVYGTPVKLRRTLEATGTGIDQTLFVSMSAVDQITRQGGTEPVKAEQAISAVLVRVRPGYAVQTVAMKIKQEVPEVNPIDSPNLLLAQRKQFNALLSLVAVILPLTAVLAVVLIELVLAMAINERRQQIGVLRALGATRRHIFISLLVEANILGIGGALAGVGITAIVVYAFRELLVESLGMPFLLPAIPSLLLIIVGLVFAATTGVTLSALVPAFAISRHEPALTMRE